MPTINVNLGNVTDEFEELDLGTYLGQISRIKLKEATEEGKFDQLMVSYTVLDEGPALGRRSTQFLSFSPKAAFMMKRFFKKFGMEDIDDLDIDDDTLELVDPDLIDVQVIFEVKADKNAPGGRRTELVSVEDDMSDAAASAANAPDPEPEPEAEAEAEEAPAPAPAPRRPAATAAARKPATAGKPQRRSLR